ncbi:MAG: DNA mismatch repair endonuclease MutL, partial [Lachnospiraceae bacterium]|nr:DNA mismatch repair endonuclease MutL [Lachnospiraceae bacterium]
MQKIHVLDALTIDKIAAGEVVERPSSVVKELLENAIDAGSDHISVEIKNGGIDYIRITDNGSGIVREDVKTAFCPHATSKINGIDDLNHVSSLGFRGEALSSIASVARVEMLTKTNGEICGTRYVIEGGREMVFEDAGIPDGTTLIVRNLFYNVPARRKFLKTATTEGTMITDLMGRMMLSHPDIAFKYMMNGTVKLQSNGDGDPKTVLYQLFGKDVCDRMLPVEYTGEHLSFHGFVGKPEIARSNHNYTFCFVNHRSIKSTMLNRALDEAYRSYLMLHKFPYALLYFEIPQDLLDVNVHPAKLEIRFLNAEEVYTAVADTVSQVLKTKELIPDAGKEIRIENEKPSAVSPEPFETSRLQKMVLSETPAYHLSASDEPYGKGSIIQPVEIQKSEEYTVEQPSFLTEEARKCHRLIGQLFDTYWLVEYEEKLFLIDQHAAHEKIRYERFVKQLRAQSMDSQIMNPPLILTLNASEEDVLNSYREEFSKAGFEIEHFGGTDYALRAVPTELYGMRETDYFLELLDSLAKDRGKTEMESILARLASMSCKGAIKAGNRIS